MFNNTQTSGKVVAATFFGVALISFALWKTFFTHVSPLDEEITAVNSKNILESEVYLKDSDNDGVYDWEEALFGTDPHNPDTDGDGISDSEEIAVTRKSYEENLEAGETTSTQTDKIAREIFGAYIQSKQQGTYDDESFDFLIAETTNLQFDTRYVPQYSMDSLNTTPDTSISSAQKYETDFQNAILPITVIQEYELTTYGRAIELNDPAEFEKLADAALVYERIAETLLNMSVPTDAAQPHLDLINAFDTFAQVLRTMGASLEDPIRSFVVARDFIEAEDAIKIAYGQIDIYFTLKEMEL